MVIETRLAAVADAPVVAAMVVALTREISRRMSRPHPNLNPEQTAGLCAELLSRGCYEALLALRRGEPVGFVGLSEGYALYAGGALGTLQELYVKPGWRCGGVGSALLASVTELARRRGWVRIEIYTPPLPGCERSAFYLRHGFEVAGGRKMRCLL